MTHKTQSDMRQVNENNYKGVKGKHTFYLNLLNIRFKYCSCGLSFKEKCGSPLHKENHIIKSMQKVLSYFVEDITYKTIYEDLCAVGRTVGYIYDSPKVIKEYMNMNNFYRDDICISDEITVGEYMFNHRHGIYLINTGKYSVAYVNGTMYDRKLEKVSDSFITSLISSVYYYSDIRVIDD